MHPRRPGGYRVMAGMPMACETKPAAATRCLAEFRRNVGVNRNEGPTMLMAAIGHPVASITGQLMAVTPSSTPSWCVNASSRPARNAAPTAVLRRGIGLSSHPV